MIKSIDTQAARQLYQDVSQSIAHVAKGARDATIDFLSQGYPRLFVMYPAALGTTGFLAGKLADAFSSGGTSTALAVGAFAAVCGIFPAGAHTCGEIQANWDRQKA